MTASTPAIETRGLCKSFGRTEALAPLDLVIPRGAIFALVGHNGAGKTTLIKLLLNILRPTDGTATILGESTAALTGASFTHIGYVSENQELPDWMTPNHDGLPSPLLPHLGRRQCSRGSRSPA